MNKSERGIPNAESPWRFKAVIEGDLVHISATFDEAGIERFRHKILAIAKVLDDPGTAPSQDESAVRQDAPQSDGQP